MGAESDQQLVDALNRGPLVRAIARILAHQQPPIGQDSLVLAIYGPWGSGKTFVKNLLLEEIENSELAERLTVHEFNPWLLAESSGLAEALMGQVGSVLGSTVGAERAKEVRKHWRRYLASLGIGIAVAQWATRTAFSVSIFLPIIIVSVVGATLALAGQVLWALLGASAVALVLLVTWRKVIASVVNYLDEVVDDARSNPQGVQNDLAEVLRTSTRRLVLIVDDLDRLTKAEMREVVRALKVNMNLPNVIHLILADRQIVESALDEVAPGRGRAFVQRLIDISVDLPEAPQETLRAAFIGRVVVAGLGTGPDPSEMATEFNELWRVGLASYVRTLCDVERICAGLALQMVIFSDAGDLTVNLLDLAVLETLRQTEPDLYWRLCQSVSTVTSALPPNASINSQQEKRAAIETLIGAAAPERRESAARVLAHLFPAISEELTGTGAGIDRWGAVQARRVSRQEVMETYVNRYPPPEVAVPRDVSMVVLAQTEEELFGAVDVLAARGALASGIEHAIAHVRLMQQDDGGVILAGIMSLGERYRTHLEPRYPFGLEPLVQLWAARYLERESDLRRRAEAFEAAVRRTEAIMMPLLLNHERCSDGTLLLGQVRVKERSEALLHRIRRAATSGQLARHPQLGTVIMRWSGLAEEEEPKQYLLQLLLTAEGVVSVLKGFRPEVLPSGAAEEQEAAEERDRRGIQALLNHLSSEDVKMAAMVLDGAFLSDSDARFWARFRRQLRARKLVQ